MPYCDEYLRIIEKLQGKYYQIGEIFFFKGIYLPIVCLLLQHYYRNWNGLDSMASHKAMWWVYLD